MGFNKNDFFPRGLALGKNFCNRVKEQKRLLQNIESAIPTLVMSTRRYGKTSLTLTVLNKNKISYAYIDLFAEIDEDGISNAILSGVGEILYKLESGPKKAIKLVTEFFSGLSLSFRFKGAEIKVDFSKSSKSPAKLILEILEKLDKVLQQKNKKTVLFFDEFQRINEMPLSISIEGALRSMAQKSQNICFVFSGSNRHMLSKMFEDRARPFYNLCDKISLERISEKDYIVFIQNKAKKRWKKTLNKEVIDKIFYFSKRHPYYLNVLCHKLWNMDRLPTEKVVIDIWNDYVEEEKSKIVFDLENLSANQAKMVRSLAKYGPKYKPTSKEFLAATKFSSSSAAQTLKQLLAKDYIYLDNKGIYHVLDPLMEYLFKG